MTPADDPIDDFREWREHRHDRMWADEVWPRAFWFDAFLSHRRGDWSRELAAALASHAARVYHDRDVAVRDARVEFELDNALQHSRFVIACLTPGLGESLYCRVEYLPALRHGASVAVPRVLVARRDGSPVPSELEGARIFDVRDPAGVRELATVVTRENRVGFPRDAPAVVRPADVFTHDCQRRIEQLDRAVGASSDYQSSQFRKDFALREVGLWAQAVLSGSIDDISHREQALGVARTAIVEDGIATPDWHDYVWRCAFVMTHTPLRDPAEVGTEVFLWAARHGMIADERRLIVHRIWAETSSNGRATLCAPLLDRLGELSEPDSVAAERAAATYPGLFSKPRFGLLSRASSAVRAKVGVPGLGQDQLPPAEAIHLIRERLLRVQQAWFDEPDSVGVFDVENVARELSDRVMRSDDPPSAPALVEAYERALESRTGRPPLVMRLELPELVHLVHRPLGRLHADDPIRVRCLLTTLHRAMKAAGFRRTGAIVARQTASGGPFDTSDLSVALADDCRDLERRRRARSGSSNGEAGP